jgi:hypothetical protein
MNQGQRMNTSCSGARSDEGRPAARTAALTAVVGASYTFDPAADGMAGIYAVRVLDRGGDPRALYAEIRAERGSSTERRDLRRAHASPIRTVSFGRGSASHQPGPTAASQPPRSSTRAEHFGRSRPATHDNWRWRWFGPPRVSRRLAAAATGLSLLLPLAVLVAGS